jgi:lipopolysaccharide transport system ATP-binding protein
MNGAILGMRRCEIEKKFDDIVDFAGVEAYIDTPVKRYSSGMYVRLAFAVAAFLEPEILIVDEVLAVGDAEFQKKCLGRMKDVSVNDGRTVLFVSHNIGAVKTLCNNGVLLENGFLKSYGDITKIIEIYQNNKDNILSVQNEFINIKQLPVFINKVELLVNGKKPVNGVVDFLDQLSFNVYLNVTKKVKNRGIIIHCNDTHDTLFQAFDISAHHEYLEGREIGQYFLNILFWNSFLKEGYFSFDFEVGHFGVGIEQFEKSAIQINVGVVSRNPRFEAATLKRTNRFYIEPTWKYEKLDNYE